MLSKAAVRKRAQRARPTMTECDRCGATDKRLSRHHPDYNEPEAIEVLCSDCHPKADAEHKTRRTKKPKTCIVCGKTFTNYSHSRVKTCSKQCLSEAGRRNAAKRWAGGTKSRRSPESQRESRTALTDLAPSATPSSLKSQSGSVDASSTSSESE